MAAQQVQAYLERHRIGALFEDLMAKVIKDTPDEPIVYLIKVLKGLYSEGGSKGPRSSLPPSGSKGSFSRSMGLTGTPVARYSLDEDTQGRSMLAKSWGGPDSHPEGAKFRPGSGSKGAGRDYPRPWMSGSKPSKSIGAMDRDNMRPPARSRTADNDKPAWNHKTAVPSHDFDEWFDMQNRPTTTGDEGAREYQRSSSWGRNGEMVPEMPAERTVIYNRRAPSTGPVNYADDSLEEELNVGRDIKIREDENESSSVASYESSRSRKQKARHAAEEHRRQLQALLLNKNYGRGDVNGINDSEDLPDDGTELLENVDELESEGVSNFNSTGARLSKSMKQGTAAPESIRVSICARCAKIITGQPSDHKSEVGSVHSARSGSEVDDNFDSVSQVGSTAGLSRPPVWPSGFDSESGDSSPRKGQHMWQSPGRSPPVKGKHMFRGGSFTGDRPDSSRPPTASSSRSDLVYSGRQQKSWNVDGYSSDNDTEVNYDRVGSPELGGSRPWNRAQVESGSEADWDTRQGRRAPERRFARFNSGDESDST